LILLLSVSAWAIFFLALLSILQIVLHDAPIMGGGMRHGIGRGMGRGMDMFIYHPQTPVMPTPTKMSKEQEIEVLTLHIQKLEKQLNEVRKRLEELRG
jgi:hypothetical protein